MIRPQQGCKDPICLRREFVVNKSLGIYLIEKNRIQSHLKTS